MANQKKKPSMWERTEYDIISETETETEIIGIIRNRYRTLFINLHSRLFISPLTARINVLNSKSTKAE